MERAYPPYDQIKDYEKLMRIYELSNYNNELAYRLKLNLAKRLEKMILPDLLKLAGMFGTKVIGQIRSDIESHNGIMLENENKYPEFKLARHNPEGYKSTLRCSV